MSYLAKGALILTFLILNLLHLSGLVQVAFHITAIAGCYFMMLSGTYLLCEYIWPKRE
jgi:hypothetical protein